MILFIHVIRYCIAKGTLCIKKYFSSFAVVRNMINVGRREVAITRE